MSEVVLLHSELPTPQLTPVPSLPPLDAWKIEPSRIQKFQVPTDDRKFVLPVATIEEVLSYFHDDYEWPVNWSKDAEQVVRPDDHHFHWTASEYKSSNFTKSGKLSSVPLKFRELPTMRGVLPR